MLDTETKHRIDTARDILVGKVPDPKSQVEQITIALIYKFMDDMDAMSEELGGERSFFAGEFGRYSWAKLMQPGLGGHEMLGLYAEAIQRMDQNAGIPQLFRDIFSNAFLPYRDPETLRVFLKVVDGFTYDNSERLGDAFEYLLSVMDSQGDAGQFRTPRHIIDFIVSIVDPKKEDVVLDPACGTAGFLISSYKHILAANTDADGNSSLTPDERARLARNLMGYDISPDMVRLSLVNMYLHGLVDPHIYEYDTLTSEERWNEFADVILANPPFMSPKGGIRPHSRFSMNSKRSEVLFVDYMAEHLNAGGRAGIIVPEGIIFQSQNAHKQLRKKLVEGFLVAVVSLPAGVFKPYSGVKTSILLLDKALARKTDRIAFFKVENDGYDLGAQRRPIEQNDLPQVKAEIAAYMQRLRAGDSSGNVQSALAAERRAEYTTAGSQPGNGLIVEKGRVAAAGEYSLSGERYRESRTDKSKYEWVKLGSIIVGKPQYGSGARKVPYDNEVRYVRITDITDSGELKSDDIVSPSVIEPDRFLTPKDLLIARSGSVGRTYLHEELPGIYQYAGYLIRFQIDLARAIPKYVYHVTRSDAWREWILSNSKTGTLTNINAKQYSSFRFPLPPLDVQQEIVAEIEGYQKVIDGARAVVENYRPHIHIDPDWLPVKIGDLVENVLIGLVRSKADQNPELPYKYIKMNNITRNGTLDLTDLSFVNATPEELNRYSLRNGDYLYNTRNSPDLVGKSAVFFGKANIFIFNNNILRIRFCPEAIPAYVNLVMNSEFGKARIRALVDGTTSVAALYQKNYLAIEIPLPPFKTQQAIVAEIEAEQSLVNANRELIDRFEKKIQGAIARVWGDEA